MTLLYEDPRFGWHETGLHPERAERIREIPLQLQRAGLDARCRRPAWEPAAREQLTLVHSPQYVDAVWALAKGGGGELDPDTVVSPSSYDVALLAVGSVVDATHRILRGEDQQALCLVRPPGHHALPTHGMGFCLFNNVAVAAQVAIEQLGLQRVLVVDWDVHHGNGTQAVFWEEPRVGCFSIHRWPFYPGTGREDEIGEGEGRGATRNVPIAYGTSRREYLARFHAELEPFAAQIRPQLVYISAGWDAHRLDPIGNLGLEVEDFVAMTDLVLDLAESYAGGRVISVLEGGYDPAVVAEAVTAHLSRFLRRAAPVVTGTPSEAPRP